MGGKNLSIRLALCTQSALIKIDLTKTTLGIQFSAALEKQTIPVQLHESKGPVLLINIFVILTLLFR